MKQSALLAALALSFCFFACKTTQKVPGQGDGVIEIVFLHLNDVYEISPMSDNTGGLARVATLRKELTAKNPNTVTILAGDFISPSVAGTLRHEGKRIRGKQMIETMNAVGVQWVVLGNHEFDYDQEDLQARLDESQFNWLGANARLLAADGSAQPFFKNTASGKMPCPDNTVLNFKDADGTTLRLGMFGVLLDSGKKPWVKYADWFESAKTNYAQLKPQTDAVVALTHLNVADDLKLAGMLPEIPLFMGGHDHDNQIHKVGPATVAKADANARTAYIHTLTYNHKTKKCVLRSELRRIDNTLADEPATAAVVTKWETIKNTALKTSGFDPDKTVIELPYPVDCREAVVRHGQCEAGTYLTAAMMAVGKHKPEAALLNSGSIRVDDVLRGTLTELDAIRTLPFGGGLQEIEMRGSLLRRVLTAGLNNKGSGGYLQWSGITQGGNGEWYLTGQALDDAKTYRIILPEFLLTGNEKGLDFLKTALQADGKTTTNPEVTALYKPDPNDKSDLRNDIRWAVISYLRGL